MGSLVQAAKLQKYSDKLSRHFKAAQQKAAEAEAVHATATAHHLKKLEDKEVCCLCGALL